MPKTFATTSAVAIGAGILACSVIAGPAHAASASDTDRTAIAETATAVWNRLDAADDPAAAYAKLSREDRAAFDAYLLPAGGTESVTLRPTDDAARAALAAGDVEGRYDSTDAALAGVGSTRGCWGSYARYTEKAALGNAIWDTYTEGSWCGNGSSVTSATFSRSWSTIAAVGWRDGGQVGKGAGVASNRARIWSQRKMVLGAGGWDAQTRNPCLRLNGTASGGTSASQTCSIY